jgi:hypothetical protein
MSLQSAVLMQKDRRHKNVTLKEVSESGRGVAASHSVRSDVMCVYWETDGREKCMLMTVM